jgi:hypothetical protein
MMADSDSMMVPLCRARYCLKCRCVRNHKRKLQRLDFHLVLSFLRKDPEHEIAGHALKSLIANRDFEKNGTLVFEMPNGKQEKLIDLAPPCRQSMARAPM